MTSMHEDLVTRLRSDAGVIAAAGVVNSRAAIDWVERPRDVFPCATLEEIDAGDIFTLGGKSGLAGTLIQADCWGLTFGDVKILERAIVSALEQTGTAGTTDFSYSLRQSSRSVRPEDLGSGLKVFRASLDFEVWNEPA